MQEAAVHEHRSNQSPPLAVDGQRPVVRTPAEQLRRIEQAESSPCDGHGSEDADVRQHDAVGDPSSLVHRSEMSIEISKLRPTALKSGRAARGE
jgi:hypothetical protein